MNTQPKYSKRRYICSYKSATKPKTNPIKKQLTARQTPINQQTSTQRPPKQQKTNHTATTLSSYLAANKSDNSHLTQIAPNQK